MNEFDGRGIAWFFRLRVYAASVRRVAIGRLTCAATSLRGMGEEAVRMERGAVREGFLGAGLDARLRFGGAGVSSVVVGCCLRFLEGDEHDGLEAGSGAARLREGSRGCWASGTWGVRVGWKGFGGGSNASSAGSMLMPPNREGLASYWLIGVASGTQTHEPVVSEGFSG